MSLALTDVSENTSSFSFRVRPNIYLPRKLRLINRSQYHPPSKKTPKFSDTNWSQCQ